MIMSTIDVPGGLETIGILDRKESLDENENCGLTEAHDLIVQTEILKILVTHEHPHPISNHPAGRNHEPLGISVQRVLGLQLQVLPPLQL